MARGEGIRNVLPVPIAGTGTASVQVAEVAHFLLGGEAGISAGVKGTAKAEFFLAGLSTGEGLVSGRVIRTIRMPRVSYATGLASLEAEAYIYVYVRGEVARAYARPFGTYFYVGRGESPAIASAKAQALQIRVAGGNCAAFGGASATAQAASNGVGLSAEAQAFLDSDPELEIEGVTHVFGRGEAVGKALPHAEEYIYTVMLAVGRVTAAGDAQALRASRGRVRAASSATGSMERVIPFEGSVVVGAVAIGGAKGRLAAFASARVAPVASSGSAASIYGAMGQVRTDSTASARSLRVALETHAGEALGRSSAENPFLLRDTLGAGAVAASLSGVARPSAAFLLSGAADGLTKTEGAAAFHPKISISGDGRPAALVVSLEERLAERAAGEALPQALPEGTNAVAGGDQVLIRRVIIVGPVSRTSVLPATSRSVFVGGASRLLAA